MLPLRPVFILSLALAVSACASKPVEPYPRPAPEHALPVRADGAFSDIEAAIRGAHGPEASGFELLDSNEDGLRWRPALIDSARHSIDVQYYLWYGDTSGRLLVKRLLDAADRGVKVRMLVDDLNTLISDASGKVTVRDNVAAWLDAHPTLELRLFNPWKDRALAGRIGESLSDLQRVNQRMHNKAMIADNQATILGGRNIGDEYVGLNPEFNLHALDLICIGPVARQASAVFDLYWDSDWVMPASALALPSAQTDLEATRARLAQQLAQTPALARFPVVPQTWAAELAALRGRLHIGTSRVESDVPGSDAIRREMLEVIYGLLANARREVLIVNAYIIPGDRSIESLRQLYDSGVTMKVLTSSLASHDVPAVNSHYKKWRKSILETGAQLYEMRHDAAIQPLVSDTPPTRAKFMGLHSKGMVVDRERVYVGSMNFDPRSAGINTEMGVVIESRGLAEALARLIERDMLPANSWRVELDDGGGLRWVNDRETATSQPARGWSQRVQDVIFMAFPKELY
jgi:putative cardiolipin synthase